MQYCYWSLDECSEKRTLKTPQKEIQARNYYSLVWSFGRARGLNCVRVLKLILAFTKMTASLASQFTITFIGLIVENLPEFLN